MESAGRWLVWLGLMALLCGCTATSSVVPDNSDALHVNLGHVRVTMHPQAPVDLGAKGASFTAAPNASGATVAARSVSAVGESFLYVDALDFSPDKPSAHAYPLGDWLQLKPVQGNALTSVANCTYDVTLASEPNQSTVALDWQDAPPVAETFVGLSNWQRGTWEWFQVDEDGVITLPGWDDYRSADGRLLLTVLLTGSQRGLLRGVKLGKSEERGTGIALPAQPVDTPPLYVPAVPDSVDLTPLCAPVHDQGGWESCSAFAFGDGAYNIILQDIYGRLGWDDSDPHCMVSAKYLYVMSGQRFGWPHSGSYLRYLDQPGPSLMYDGSTTLEHAPYDGVYDWDWSQAALDDASVLRIDSQNWVSARGDAGRQTVHGLLNLRRPVLLSMWIDSRFTSYTGGIYDYTGPSFADHVVCIVGYDDVKQAYKVRNSWGKGWGEDGYIWISYVTVDNPDAHCYCYSIDDSYSAAVAERFLPGADSLAAPTMLAASKGADPDGVHLRWNPVAGADGYRVYRDTPHNCIADVTVKQFTDKAVELDVSHIYWVAAYKGGVESVQSNSDIGFLKSGHYPVIQLPDGFNFGQ